MFHRHNRSGRSAPILLVFAALVLAEMLGAPVAAAADLTGGWVVHAEWGPKFKYDLACGFTQQAQAFAGPCMALGAPPEGAGGTLEKDKLEIEYTTQYQGYDVGVHFHGVVDAGGAVSGTVESGQALGGFNGVQIGPAGPMSNWRLHVHVAQFDFQMLCALKVKGRYLRGPCGAGDGVVLRTIGTMDDKAVTFAYDTSFAGMPLHVVYTGALQPDGSIKGTAFDGAHSGIFTAKRR